MEVKEIYWLKELSKEHNDLVGKKCANLGELVKLGLKVPYGFALSTMAYEHFMTATGLKEEHRIVRTALREKFIRNFLAGQFGHLSHNPIVKCVLGSPFCDVSQDFNFSRQPCIAAPLNVVGYKVVEKHEDQHGPACKRQGCPQRDAPGCAMHGWANDL